MKLDQTTQSLFSPFDREVANPKRWRIHNKGEFIRFIENNSGRADCFSSIYPADGSIDKIYFDLDDPKGIVACRDEAEQLYSWLVMKGFNVIPVLSGKKGFNLYLLLKSKQYENSKKLLTKATYSILCDAFGYDKETGEVKTDYVDAHPIGDVRRISRIPNTLRPPENLTWCTYLPEDWVKMSTAELVSQMKSPRTYEYDLDGTFPMLEEFRDPPSEIMKRKIIESVEPARPMKGNVFLKNLLRPCLYRHMMSDHPGHAVRVAATVDLLGFFEPSKILEMYRVLNWTRWDPDLTLNQIYSCRHLKPYGCKKLRQLGIPEVCCVG